MFAQWTDAQHLLSNISKAAVKPPDTYRAFAKRQSGESPTIRHTSYPALYNGSDVFNNISGIPVELVERIEILPGG